MRKAATRALAIFFLHLAQMEKAGVPLRKALEDAAQEASYGPLKKAAAGVAADVRCGRKLHEAMAAWPQVFDATLTGLVAAGEEGGRLAFVLDKCRELMRRRAERQSRMARATLSAKITLVVVLALVVFRQGIGAVSPLVALIALAAAFLLLRRISGPFRAGTDRLLLLLPGIGPVARGHFVARFCEELAILHESGLDLRKSLHAAMQSVPNRAVRREAWEALLLLEGGASLHRAFSAATRFDPLVLSMIRAGEDSGALARTLHEAAAWHGRRTDEALTALQQVSGPALVILAGVMLYLSLKG